MLDWIQRGKIVWIVLLLGIMGVTEVYAGEKIPRFYISNMAVDSKRFSNKKAKNSYVISFFFVGCKPCIKEMPELYKLITTEFPATTLLFIDPIAEDSENKIRRFVEDLHIPLDYVYRDGLGRIGKKFFKGEMRFPTVIGAQKRTELFRHSELDEKAVENIRNVLKNS
ncbi:MAG: redoxin domain-containing protein [SAR324 cluster bacterium]|nr:redoxin domain-containing protein [SAR324 cluster bacterium]